MGQGSSYLKLKTKGTVATFVYWDDDNYVKRDINCHNTNYSNKIEIVTRKYYENYSGEYFTFDGNYKKFNAILSEFKPNEHTTIDLISRLECEADLAKHTKIWNKLWEWAKVIAKTALATLPYIANLAGAIAMVVARNNPPVAT